MAKIGDFLLAFNPVAVTLIKKDMLADTFTRDLLHEII